METQRPFRSILVAVDGSDHAFDAVRVASRLAAALSAKLTLMTAYHAPSDSLGEPNYSRALGEALAEAQRILDDARNVALNAGSPEPLVEWLAGQPVELSSREFSLLQMLLESAGRVLTRSQLEQSIYGWREDPDSNALEVHIHHLRKKLGSSLIRTLRGVGYTIAK